MKNKFIKAIALMLVMVIGIMPVLAGCGDNKDAKESEKPSETVSENVESTEKVSEEATETASEETSEEVSEEVSEPVEKVTINIAALKGATAMGMVKLMSENETGASANNYNFEILTTADEINAGIIKGTLDIAAIPVNAASALYNKTEGKIKMLNINTLGVLYIVDATDSVKTIVDLKGKTIYSVGQGTTPEFTLKYVLQQNGLLDDVTVEFKTETAELATMLAEGQAELALLPEPYVTTVLASNENVKIALSLNEEWAKVQTNFQMLTGSVIVRTEFLENNKEAVDMFLEEYEKSVNFVNENIDEGAALVEKYGIVPKAPIAKQAIPRCNIVFISGEQMKTDVMGYLGVLFDAEPKSVGGKLPDDAFFYSK